MSDNRSKVEVAGIMGPVWFIGWLFTIGFVKLDFLEGISCAAVLAVLSWCKAGNVIS